MATACLEELVEGNTCYELGWEVKVMIEKKTYIYTDHAEMSFDEFFDLPICFVHFRLHGLYAHIYSY